MSERRKKGEEIQDPSKRSLLQWVGMGTAAVVGGVWFTKEVCCGDDSNKKKPEQSMPEDITEGNRKTTAIDINQTLDCKGLRDADVSPYGKIKYRTGGMPNKQTVIAIRMLSNSSDSGSEEGNLIKGVNKDIVGIGEELFRKGMRAFGTVGRDTQELKKGDRYPRSLYAPAKLESMFGHRLYTQGIDDVDSLKRMSGLFKQGKLEAGLKIQQERSENMVTNIVGMLKRLKLRCLTVMANSGHLEKGSVKPIEVHTYDLVELLETEGLNVVVVEPASYKKVWQELMRISQDKANSLK